VRAPSGEQYEIRFEDQRVVIVEVGGGLRFYSASGRELLDGYAADEMCTSGRGQVLIPWPNRIQHGIYEFEGRQHQLPLTEPEAQNAIHGLVRWESWSVVERDPHCVVLEHVLHAQPGYPFTLALRIEYALSERGLSVRTTATNLGSSPCPYGAGAHPYLTLGTETVDALTLHAPARIVLVSDEGSHPIGAESVEGTEFDFREPRPIGSTVLDHCFDDLVRDDDGFASVALRDPDAGTGVTLRLGETYRYLMLYTGDPRPDVARRSLAVEPMTCPPNAFRTGDGLLVLEPGASTEGVWGISAKRENRR
jgi:aldose 1-epimerase